MPPETTTQEEPLVRYRQFVKWVWTGEQLSELDAQWLESQANRLDLSHSDASAIERDVMGETKEGILEQYERAAKDKERKEKLDGLYAQARKFYQEHQWQAVVDVFAKISEEDPAYPDPEGLLEAARGAEARAQRVATTYVEGQQHMSAKQWPQALRSFEQTESAMTTA
jgi:hypothetical protein